MAIFNVKNLFLHIVVVPSSFSPNCTNYNNFAAFQNVGTREPSNKGFTRHVLYKEFSLESGRRISTSYSISSGGDDGMI